MEGGSSLTPMVPAHLSGPLNTGRGIGTETCGVEEAFSPDDPWFGSDTYTNCAMIYNSYFDVWLMGYVICI